MSDKQISIQQVILGSHLWLGICGVVCTWGTFVLLNQSVSFLYLGFVLAGTMTIYSFHSYITLKTRQLPATKNPAIPAYLKFTLIAGSILTLLLFLMLTRTNQLILLFPAGLALLYVFPVYKGRRLKDYPFVKIIAIVLAWTTITYWIPVHSIPQWWAERGYDYLLVDRLLFFFALALPFDVRDIQYDLDRSLKTIPNTIGLYNTQFLALFSIFLAAGFMSMGIDNLDINAGVRFGNLAVYFLLGIIILGLKKLPGSEFYSWVIDGVLFLYGLELLILSN